MLIFKHKKNPNQYSNLWNTRDDSNLVKECGLKMLKKNANIFTCTGCRLAMCEREKENI